MGVCGGLALELGCTASGGYLSFFGERKVPKNVARNLDFLRIFGYFLCAQKVPAGGRHADLSTNFLCEETGIYTDEK